MVIPELPVAEKLEEVSQWDDAPPVSLEEQEMDVLAFELWQRGSRQDLAAGEERPDETDAVASRTSCL